MATPQDDLDRLIAEYTAQHEQLAAAQDRIRSANTTVTSAKNLLTVTLDAAGEIEQLTFNNRDYRTMGPEDLAAVVRGTIEEARRQMSGRVQEAMSGLFGDPSMFADMMSGTVDWQKMLPADLFDGLNGEPDHRPDGERGRR